MGVNNKEGYCNYDEFRWNGKESVQWNCERN